MTVTYCDYTMLLQLIELIWNRNLTELSFLFYTEAQTLFKKDFACLPAFRLSPPSEVAVKGMP